MEAGSQPLGTILGSGITASMSQFCCHLASSMASQSPKLAWRTWAVLPSLANGKKMKIDLGSHSWQRRCCTLQYTTGTGDRQLLTSVTRTWKNVWCMYDDLGVAVPLGCWNSLPVAEIASADRIPQVLTCHCISVCGSQRGGIPVRHLRKALENLRL